MFRCGFIPYAFGCAYLLFLGSAFSQGNLHLGDVDDDAVVTVRDIALVIEHVKGTTSLDEHHAVLADVTKDGAVNQADVDELIKEVLETRTPENLPLSTVRFTSPATGEGDVSVNRETIVHFTVPLAINATLDTTRFHADFAERKVLSRVEISSDRKKASLFYLEPLPANSRVKITLDGSTLTDLLGRPVDADNDGAAGGIYRMSFDTHTNGGIPATGVTGRVLLAAPEGCHCVPNGFQEVPVPGVTITVDGQEQSMRAVTDAQGYFTLSPCPTGVFFVHIDGRTSPMSHYPTGSYLPAVGKQWEAVAGKGNNLSGSSSDTTRGLIYLPRICAGTLRPVSQTQDTTVVFPQQVLTTTPALAGTAVGVPANSVFSDDGTRGGQIGIAPVPPDRLPSPLPPGLNLPLVITVQSDGATNFDRPAPVTFPNLPDPVTGLKPGPGEKSALWSFNHDTGQWEVVGPMTVTPDGNFVKSDAGVGIMQPGWHGTMPGGQLESPPPGAPCNANLNDPISGNTCPPEKCGLFNYGFIKPSFDVGLDLVEISLDFAKGKALGDLAEATGSKILQAIGLADDAAGLATLPETVNQVKGHLSDYDKANKRNIDCQLAYQQGICDQLGRTPCPESPPGQEDRSHVLDALRQLEAAIANAAANANAATNPAAAISGARDTLANMAGRVNPNDPNNFGLSEAEIQSALAAINVIKAGQSSLGALQGSLESVMQWTEYVSSIVSIVFIPPSNKIQSSCYILFEPISSSRTAPPIRAISYPNGGIQINLMPDMLFRLKVYDGSSQRIGQILFRSPRSGVVKKIPSVPLVVDVGRDADTDGISDEAEHVVGTNLNLADSDNDGVTDGAELKNGTDPLSGLAAATGIVAKAEFSMGDCRDVGAVNDVLVAAFGAEGLHLLGVRQGLSPTKLAKVQTPSPADVVAMTGSLVAVGIGSGTLIVDASTPDTPQVLRTIKLGSRVKSLAAVENTVYIGFEDGRLAAVDMLAGRLIASVNVGAAVQDVAIGNGVVYAATVSSLKTVPVTATGGFGAVGNLSMSASSGAGGQRLRLFRGTDRLYVVHTQGYNVFNITAPTAPVFIRNNTDNQFGWRHLVANGSGLALAATGPNSTDDGPHDVSLYDLGADNAQANFLTTFTLPGPAYASVFYNGLAYVATGSAGVQVVNIRPFDTLKVPPSIALNVASTGGAVVEGGFVFASALVTDDVQVRNVEFYVDGVKVETDGNFPFEARLLAPRIEPGKTTAVFRAKATDTGGNAAWSNEITLNLSTEITPPTVLGMTPPNGQFLTQCAGFTLKFSEPVKTATLNSSTIRFYASGPDGRIGTDDDLSVPATLLPAASGSGTYRDTASWQATTPLLPGIYRVLATLGVQDTAGNGLAAPFSGVFTVSGGSDSDGDGLADDVEIALGYDPENQDSNGNGKADGDEDFDGDGLSNALELRYGLQPNNTDSNANGIADNLEDADKDTLTTAQELAAGSDPTKSDTDGDGWPDQVEVEFASNAADARSKPLSMFIGAPTVTTAIIGGGTTVATPPTHVVIITGASTIATPPASVRIGSQPP